MATNPIDPIDQDITIPPAPPEGIYDAGFRDKVNALLAWFKTMAIQFTTFIEKLNVWTNKVNELIPKIEVAYELGDMSQYLKEWENGMTVNRGYSVSVGDTIYTSRVDGNTETPPHSSYIVTKKTAFAVPKTDIDANLILDRYVITNGLNTPAPGYWIINTYFENGVSLSNNRTQIAISEDNNKYLKRSYKDAAWTSWSGIKNKELIYDSTTEDEDLGDEATITFAKNLLEYSSLKIFFTLDKDNATWFSEYNIDTNFIKDNKTIRITVGPDWSYYLSLNFTEDVDNAGVYKQLDFKITDTNDSNNTIYKIIGEY